MLPWADRFTWRASAVAPVGDTAAPVGDAVAAVGAIGQPAELAIPSHESASHLLWRQSLPMWTCRTKPVALEKCWLHGVFQLPLWMGGSRVGKHVTALRKAARKSKHSRKRCGSTSSLRRTTQRKRIRSTNDGDISSGPPALAARGEPQSWRTEARNNYGNIVRRAIISERIAIAIM